MSRIKLTVQRLHKILIKNKVEELIGAEAWSKIMAELVLKHEDSSGPRAITTYKNAEGDLVARICMTTRLWLPISYFYVGTSVVKGIDKEKARIYTAAKKLETEAGSFRDEAKLAETAEDKLALYEEYELAYQEAVEARAIPVDPEIVKAITDELSPYGSDTLEGLLAIMKEED